MNDGYGRNINYLRLSVTDLCNLRCIYCMPEKGVCKKSHSDVLRFEQIVHIVSILAKMGINKIRLTGGEPLVRKGIVSLVKMLKSISGIDEIALTTNGLLLTEMAKSLKNAGLNRVNISIDSFKPDIYRYLTRGGDVHKVINGIHHARKIGLEPIKLNVVLIKDINDGEILDFINLTKKYEIDVRFIELMPIGEVAKWNEKRFVSIEEIFKRVPTLEEIKNNDKSSPAVYYKLPGASGKVGLISPISCKFCENCNRIRMTAYGKLTYCLHSDYELDLNLILKNGGNIKEEVLKFTSKKPFEHQLDKGKYIKKSMFRIGG
ncbi:MAG: GTP 3',8-cyclase MoaA [Clostridiales bacterium]